MLVKINGEWFDVYDRCKKHGKFSGDEGCPACFGEDDEKNMETLET
jgi:hypothetical protein